MTERESTTASQRDVAGLNLLKLPQESWRPVQPGNQRRAGRIGEREIERVTAFLIVPGKEDLIPVKLRDFSCTGFGVHLSHSTVLGISPHPGTQINLRLEGPWPKPVSAACEIRNVHSLREGLRLGLGRLDVASDPSMDSRNPGLLLQEGSRLNAQIANSILYNEWSDASLVELRTGEEWVFESADTSILLFWELQLEIHLDLPLETSAQCGGRVCWLQETDDGRVRFGIKVIDPGFQISNALGEHLLRTQACRPQELRKYGIYLQQFRDQLRFQFISTLEEYADVLSLRANAYKLAGKVAPETTPEKLASKHDRRTRFLAAYHGDLMVASVAMTFADDSRTPLRSEGEFPDRRYPVKVPAKDRMIELHSLCTHKDYRGGDLARSMIEHCARTLLLSDREWYITFITSDLLPLYRKIGFREAGAALPIKALGGIVHHLVLVHRDSFLTGKGLSPATWNHFFADLVRDLIEKGFIGLSRWGRVRVSTYSLLGPWARWLFQSSMRRQFRNFLATARDEGGKND